MKEKRWMKHVLQFLCLFALALVLAVPAAGAKKVSAATTSGSCGDSAKYKYDSSTKTLTLSGSGAVEAPDEWDDISSSVKYLEVGNKITDIGTYKNWSALKTVTLGKKVKSIKSNAFFRCTSLTTVDMSSSAVTKIGEDAFFDCEKLKTVTFSKKLTKISAYAFSCCYKLTAISLPSSLTTIGQYAFLSSGLKKITIPKNVTSIGTCAFYGCDSLTKIAVTSGNTKYAAKSGVLYNKAKTKLIVYPIAKTGTSFTVPSSVKKICDYAFTYNKKLKSVTIGSKVTEIGTEAFSSCAKLKTVVIGAKVKTIGAYAFSGCSALTSVKFKGSAPTFEANYDYSDTGNFAFMGVTTTIKYPSSKKSSWKKVMTALSEDAESEGGKLTFKAY